MSDSTRRGLRTAIQLIVTILTTTGVVTLLRLFDVPVTEEQWLAFTGVLLPILTTAQNALEDSGKIPAVFKAPASSGVDPIPDPSDTAGV